MEAAWLRSRLESGRSIESIAREAGKNPSTVGYWVSKHGLTSPHAARHAARREVTREVLAAMLAEGLTIRTMADRLGRSYTTVRHWLARHGLATPECSGSPRPQRREHSARTASRRRVRCTA